MIAMIGERGDVVVLSDPDRAVELLGAGSGAAATARGLLLESSSAPVLVVPVAPAGSERAPGAAPTDEPAAGANAAEPPPPPPAWMGLVIDTLERGTAELARLADQRDTLCAQLDAALAELEVTREALRWARSTAAVVDDVLRSRDRLGTKLGALRGKYRDALAAQRQLMEEHAGCAAEPAALRIAELEEQVKRVTSTGVDILINRNALAARILGWACALCGDRERTPNQAIADIDAELARLAEQRDATGGPLTGWWSDYRWIALRSLGAHGDKP